MDKDPRVPAEHFLDAIANIESDLAGYDLARLANDRRARQLLERNLEIVSEASRRLPEQLTETEPGIPWRAIAGIGNILRHAYHRTDPEILWTTVERDLPPLKDAVERILAALGESEGT